MAKILVVDDDPDIRDAATIILETAGYTVVTASNGMAGLEMIKAERPDLMILDLLMPKMDGFSVCRELQDECWSEFCEMPVLILTSVREEASRRRYELETGLELKIADYLEKPVTPDMLLERVARLIK